MDEIRDPAHLGARLLAVINAGDVETAVECYAADAILELPDGSSARGRDAIRAVYARLIASRPHFQAGQAAPALVTGDIALTTTKIGYTATAEVARRGRPHLEIKSWIAPTSCSIKRKCCVPQAKPLPAQPLWRAPAQPCVAHHRPVPHPL